MSKRNNSISIALLASSGLAMAASAFAADVTPERLLNPDKEPQNWLMNHRTYDGQRFSPLERINKSNVKGLKLAYAVPLGGGAGNEWNEATATMAWKNAPTDPILYTTRCTFESAATLRCSVQVKNLAGKVTIESESLALRRRP